MIFKASIPTLAGAAACLSCLFVVARLSALGAEPSVTVKASETRLAEMLPGLHLLEPIWKSKMAYRESVLFVADDADQTATGRLLFPATKVIAVHSADGKTKFEIGKDVTLAADGRSLVLTKDSRIASLQATDLFPPAGAPLSIPHKTGEPTKNLLFEDAHWFHDHQVEVTYEHEPVAWSAITPELDSERLPKTLARLRAGQPISLAVSGDSISAGGNASGVMKAPPYMPAYPELVAAQLEALYKSDVTLTNRAVGGWIAPQGANDLDALLAAKPDLVVIAYGMNDVAYGDPVKFGQTIAGMIERIRTANPATEVILVAPMTGHSQWVHTPPKMFPLYRDALGSLTGPGVAIADITSLWQELLRHKRELDLIGNGVNHPNDFGHRVYAQAILALLVEPATID